MSMDFQMMIMLIGLFAALAIFSLFLFFWMKSKVHDLNARISRHSDNHKMVQSELQSRIKRLEDINSDAHNKSVIENLRKDITDRYDNDIKELKEETTKLILKGQLPKTDSTTSEILIDEVITSLVYAPTSNSRGEFRDDELNDKPQRNTFFEIGILSTGEAAKLTLFDGLVYDAGILSASDQYFGYVSAFENKWRENHSRLVVTKPGRLRKSDHGWMIQEKIRVRFE